MRFSQTTGCFYPEDCFYSDLPSDVIAVPESDFKLAINRAADERVIVVDGRVALEKIPVTKELAALQILNQIDALHKEKLYTDVESTFPGGSAVIQFRNEIDRTNLSNVATGAMALVMIGQGTTLIAYRTLDNVIQQVPASQMMAIALGVLNVKQGVVAVAWQHRDAIKALANDANATAADIMAYDFTGGW